MRWFYLEIHVAAWHWLIDWLNDCIVLDTIWTGVGKQLIEFTTGRTSMTVNRIALDVALGNVNIC